MIADVTKMGVRFTGGFGRQSGSMRKRFELEVPYEAYDSGLKFMEYPHNIWPYMVQYLDFRVLKFLLQ